MRCQRYQSGARNKHEKGLSKHEKGLSNLDTSKIHEIHYKKGLNRIKPAGHFSLTGLFQTHPKLSTAYFLRYTVA